MSKEDEEREILEAYFQLTEAQRKQFLLGIKMTIKSNLEQASHLRLVFSSSSSPAGVSRDSNRRFRDA
jgi:plasmid stability protein